MKNIKFEKQDNLYVPGLTLIEGRLATNVKIELNESQTKTAGKKVHYKKQLNENMPADFEAALENSTPENPDMVSEAVSNDGFARDAERVRKKWGDENGQLPKNIHDLYYNASGPVGKYKAKALGLNVDDYTDNDRDILRNLGAEEFDEAANEPRHLLQGKYGYSGPPYRDWDTTDIDRAYDFGSREESKKHTYGWYDPITYYPVDQEETDESLTEGEELTEGTSQAAQRFVNWYDNCRDWGLINQVEKLISSTQIGRNSINDDEDIDVTFDKMPKEVQTQLLQIAGIRESLGDESCKDESLAENKCQNQVTESFKEWADAYSIFQACTDRFYPDEDKIIEAAKQVYEIFKGDPNVDKAWEQWNYLEPLDDYEERHPGAKAESLKEDWEEDDEKFKAALVPGSKLTQVVADTSYKYKFIRWDASYEGDTDDMLVKPLNRAAKEDAEEEDTYNPDDGTLSLEYESLFEGSFSITTPDGNTVKYDYSDID